MIDEGAIFWMGTQAQTEANLGKMFVEMFITDGPLNIAEDTGYIRGAGYNPMGAVRCVQNPVYSTQFDEVHKF